MTRCYEEDRIQCQAINLQTKVRCHRIGTHSNGGKVLCEAHHQLAIKKKEKDGGTRGKGRA